MGEGSEDSLLCSLSLHLSLSITDTHSHSLFFAFSQFFPLQSLSLFRLCVCVCGGLVFSRCHISEMLECDVFAKDPDSKSKAA